MENIFTSVEFLKVLVPSVIAILLAFISHQLAKTREINESRRKHKIDYLLKAYQALMTFSNNPNELESAIALRDACITIQIYGSKWQVEQVRKLNDTMRKDGTFELDPLLNNLRDELRNILKLEMVDGNVYWTHPHPRLTQNLNLNDHQITKKFNNLHPKL